MSPSSPQPRMFLPSPIDILEPTPPDCDPTYGVCYFDEHPVDEHCRIYTYGTIAHFGYVYTVHARVNNAPFELGYCDNYPDPKPWYVTAAPHAVIDPAYINVLEVKVYGVADGKSTYQSCFEEFIGVPSQGVSPEVCPVPEERVEQVAAAGVGAADPIRELMPRYLKVTALGVYPDGGLQGGNSIFMEYVPMLSSSHQAVWVGVPVPEAARGWVLRVTSTVAGYLGEMTLSVYGTGNYVHPPRAGGRLPWRFFGSNRFPFDGITLMVEHA